MVCCCCCFVDELARFNHDLWECMPRLFYWTLYSVAVFGLLLSMAMPLVGTVANNKPVACSGSCNIEFEYSFAGKVHASCFISFNFGNNASMANADYNLEFKSGSTHWLWVNLYTNSCDMLSGMGNQYQPQSSIMMIVLCFLITIPFWIISSIELQHHVGLPILYSIQNLIGYIHEYFYPSHSLDSQSSISLSSSFSISPPGPSHQTQPVSLSTPPGVRFHVDDSDDSDAHPSITINNYANITTSAAPSSKDHANKPSREFMCIICFENPRLYLTTPCGHFGYCHKCVNKITHCSVCRALIKSRVVCHFA